MKKYEVTLYYHASVIVTVEADNENEAIARAYLEAGDKRYDDPILHSLTADGDPDVEEI